MKVLVLVSSGLVAALVTFAANWLALIPWRRARNEHWTERARLYYPARVAAANNLWILPAVLTMLCLLVLSGDAPHWALLVLATAIGTVAGTMPMDREVFPRICLPDLLRQVGITCVFRFLMWFAFLTTAVLMPSEFNPQLAIISVVFLMACILWNRDGYLLLGQKLGWLLPAPDRLRKIVQETAALMNVSFGGVQLMRISLAQAFAVPGSRLLLFSERLVELLSDQEIAAICAHELAHLTEPRRQHFQRYVILLFFLPWILFKPMLHTFGTAGFFLLLLNTLLVGAVYRRLSHRLEIRADSVAHANEPDPGVYARALLRIHEDNLLPAVMAKGRATHPHLYDRLLAAGVTPDFPRPLPADSMAWHGRLLAASLGVLAMLLIKRMVTN